VDVQCRKTAGNLDLAKVLHMKRTFPIHEVYQEEVKKLLAARKSGTIIHNTGDIRGSGDETEIAFRQFLSRRLPAKYFVGHGHVVDRFLNVSPQCDVIIADNSATPILFEGKDGLQYFPFESVYAIGEVKSSYYESKAYVSAFAKTTQYLHEELRRAPVPPSYIGHGITLGDGFQHSEKRPLRNPLFQFMVFFDSGDYTDVAVMKEYAEQKEEFLPSIACFLDGHILSKAKINRGGGKLEIEYLECDPLQKLDHKDVDWTRMSFNEESDQRGGQALAVFMMQLFGHLDTCVLKDPPTSDYLTNVLKDSSYRLMPLSVEFFLDFARQTGIEVPEGMAYSFKDGHIQLEVPRKTDEGSSSKGAEA
jgi:hypothetical protein